MAQSVPSLANEPVYTSFQLVILPPHFLIGAMPLTFPSPAGAKLD
jgi:hypothetical protein